MDMSQVIAHALEDSLTIAIDTYMQAESELISLLSNDPEALAHYETNVGPALAALLTEINSKSSGQAASTVLRFHQMSEGRDTRLMTRIEALKKRIKKLEAKGNG